MAEESTKKLHACLDKETMDVFFASVVDRQGVNISLRSSTSLKKGKQLAMMPVPEDWDGQAIQAEEIQKSQTSFDVMVNRLEGRGAFQARMISSDERNLLDRYRSGRGNYASLDAETSSAGMVTTIKLQGIINLDTAAQIQAIIRRVGQHQTLILLDLTHLVSITRSSV
ncbi:hypothetical protein GF373_16970, partial [bacterium]|nr:hypothetical protein [bacterium]